MRWLKFSIVLLVATLLNAGNLLNTISIGSLNIRPDLLLIMLLFFGINCDTTSAIIASFVIGFAADISGSQMGPYIISYGLFGSLISQMRKVVIMKRMTHQGLAIFFTAVIAGGLAQILTLFKTGEVASNMFVVLPGKALYSGLVGPFIWLILKALSEWLGIREHHFGRLSNR
jgi:rod shape-determining protein MreD